MPDRAATHAPPPRHRPGDDLLPRADSLLASLFLVIALAVGQRGLGFVRELLFCRLMDQRELGQWALAFVFLFAAAAIVSLGLQGSMNRYVEHFRRRGQLRAYVRRVAAAATALALAGATLLYTFRAAASDLIFGRQDRGELVAILAVALAIVVANNFLVDLLSGLRLFRVVSAVQCGNSVGFMAISVALLIAGRTTAADVVVAFAAAYLVVAAATALYIGRFWRGLPRDEGVAPFSRFWPQVARFSFALWTYNCLVNGFEASSRYLIVHASGLDKSAALAAVGDFHTARLLPSLLATAAALVASTMMPHLSHDWETGRRAAVAERLRLTVKLVGLGLFACAVVALWGAPLLFDAALAGKYAAGREVLPWLLAAGVWTGVNYLLFNYLWCAERLKLCSVALGVALAVNVAIAVPLLPRLGLVAAGAALAAASLAQLALVVAASGRLGLRPDRGLLWTTLIPASLPLGPVAAAAALVLLAAGTIRGGVLTAEERRTLGEFARRQGSAALARWRSTSRAKAPSPHA